MLTALAIGWGPYPGFLASKVAPIVPVDKISNIYPIWGKERFQASRTRVGYRDKAPEASQTFSKDTYKCENYAEKDFLSAAEYQAADAAIRYGMDQEAKLRALQQRIENGWELDIAELLTTSGNYASGLYEDMSSGSNRNFDDSSGPGALRLLKEKRNDVRIKCGMAPDTLILSPDLWMYLSTDKNLFGGGSTAVLLTEEQLRQLLNLKQVLIGEVLLSTDKQTSAADYTLADAWGSNMAIFCTCQPGASKEVPRTAVTFAYDFEPGYQQGVGVKRWSQDEPEGEYVRYAQCRDVKLTGRSGGKIISGALMTKCYAALEA